MHVGKEQVIVMVRITNSDKNKVNDACNDREDREYSFSYHWEGSKLYLEDMMEDRYQTAFALRNMIRKLGGKFKNAKVRISIEF